MRRSGLCVRLVGVEQKRCCKGVMKELKIVLYWFLNLGGNTWRSYVCVHYSRCSDTSPMVMYSLMIYILSYYLFLIPFALSEAGFLWLLNSSKWEVHVLSKGFRLHPSGSFSLINLVLE